MAADALQTRGFERWATAAGVLSVVVLLCVPLLAVHFYQVDHPALRTARSQEVTVGIAVILRATVRRFMRTASNQFMRTAFGVVGRASARAATRHIAKAATQVTVAMAVGHGKARAGAAQSAPAAAPSQSTAVALGLGVGALALSFWGILQLAPANVVASLLANGAIAVPTACALVAVPLLVYAGVHFLLARRFAVQITYRTALEGLMLQGYFTGSGSFLPMTTDVEYDGTPRSKAMLATCALLALLSAHLLCVWVATNAGSAHAEFLGASFLVYAFIYVFPINPLEGTFLWRWHKLLWLAVAAPILASFLCFLPVSFGEIL